jgi:hypothetical protein
MEKNTRYWVLLPLNDVVFSAELKAEKREPFCMSSKRA